jgi:hypothetical protein
MTRCIYCQQDRSADAFTKVEHVMPQSFGRFQHNFTPKNLVCDDCTEGTFAGCYMLRYYNAEKNDISVQPLPQVGFMLGSEHAYRYFLLNEIPTQDANSRIGCRPTPYRPQSCMRRASNPD